MREIEKERKDRIRKLHSFIEELIDKSGRILFFVAIYLASFCFISLGICLILVPLHPDTPVVGPIVIGVACLLLGLYIFLLSIKTTLEYYLGEF